MAALSVQQATPSGLTPTYANAAGGGDTFPLDGDTAFIVKNGGGSPITVTIASKKTAVPGLSVANQAVTVAAGAESHILVDPAAFADPTSGLASVTYSAVTSVTVAAVRH